MVFNLFRITTAHRDLPNVPWCYHLLNINFQSRSFPPHQLSILIAINFYYKCLPSLCPSSGWATQKMWNVCCLINQQNRYRIICLNYVSLSLLKCLLQFFFDFFKFNCLMINWTSRPSVIIHKKSSTLKCIPLFQPIILPL